MLSYCVWSLLYSAVNTAKGENTEGGVAGAANIEICLCFPLIIKVLEDEILFLF